MFPFFSEFLCDEQAATAVEYAVMLALIIMTAIVAITSVGNANATMWGTASTEITNYTNGGS